MTENRTATSRTSIVYYVTDRRALASDDPVQRLSETIRAVAEAGVDWIQIREKDLPSRALLELSRRAVSIGKARVNAGVIVPMIVNDRLDVALAAGAAGVHLGHESVPVAEVVRWCRAGNAPPEFLIGASCHSIEEVRQAEEQGASYVFFGPIYETPSKQRFGAPQGFTRLAEACRASRIPVIAIGGINGKNAAECIRAGAAGVAAIRMFQEAADASELREAIASVHRAVQRE
jgi:thiamine-phosphate pyrophosphorylase